MGILYIKKFWCVCVCVCETIPDRTSNRPTITGVELHVSQMTMNTEQDSAFEDSTTTTLIEVAQQTVGNNITSLSSHGASFYFQCTVLVVTVVGLAAKGMVLYAMVASKQHKKRALIFNQNVLDLAQCLFLGVQCSVRLSNIYLDGTTGYWLCMLLFNDCFNWGAYLGSVINLAAISIERYPHIVHHVWAKKNLHNWMIYSTIAFTWIAGIGIAIAAIIPTSAVVNGVCFARWFFESPAAQKAFGIWNFLSFYVIILSIFAFCYGRILMAIRRQAKVMAVTKNARGLI